MPTITSTIILRLPAAILLLSLVLYGNGSKSQINDINCPQLFYFPSSKQIYLTLTERHDGMGSSVQHLLFAAAFAFRHQWGFGGLVSQNRSIETDRDPIHQSHNVDGSKYLDFLFGDHRVVRAASRVDVRAVAVDHLVLVADAMELAKISSNATNKTVYHVQSYRFPLDDIHKSRTNSCYFTIAFLNLMRKSVQCGLKSYEREQESHRIKELSKKSLIANRTVSLKQKPQLGYGNHSGQSPNANNDHQRMRVVAHLRRGDVSPTDEWRGTSDDFVIEVMKYIQRLYPQCELHALTSVVASRTTFDRARLKHLYTVNGIHLHISEENSPTATADAISALYHFITADVLIPAKSSFSQSAALFNSNCVVYAPMWHKPLDNWIILPSGKADRSSMQSTKRLIREGLPRCLPDRFRGLQVENLTTSTGRAGSSDGEEPTLTIGLPSYSPSTVPTASPSANVRDKKG